MATVGSCASTFEIAVKITRRTNHLDPAFMCIQWLERNG
jgi:hypothetical protein